MPLGKISLRWQGHRGGGRIDDLEIQSWGGKFSGEFQLRGDTSLLAGEGVLKIRDLRLGEMLATEKRPAQHARGKVSGSLALQLTPGRGLQGDGELAAKVVRLEGFSFQEHFALRSYLPELQVLRLRRVKVRGAHLTRSGLALYSIRGAGHPLSFQGRGRISPDGNFSFSLNCVLDAGYCRDLPALARDGMDQGKDGDCRFSSGLSGNTRWQSLDLAAVFGTAVGRGLDRAAGGIFGFFQ